jgi:hypothetical protein
MTRTGAALGSGGGLPRKSMGSALARVFNFAISDLTA